MTAAQAVSLSRRSKKDGGRRLHLLDLIRGITLLSMIAYHGSYDLVYHYGLPIPGYTGLPGYLWQQSICWTFLFLSGFCFSLGRPVRGHQFRRGLLLSACGLLITAVLAIVMPDSIVIMGILSFFGLAVLLTALLFPLLRRIPPLVGLIGCAFLFFLTRDIPSGYLGFEGLRLAALPDSLYQGIPMMILGFPYPGFFSTDYFPLLPWIFLFWSGTFTWRAFFEGRPARQKALLSHSFCPPLESIGSHTLILYMLHQPVLMALFTLLAQIGILA